MISPEWEKSFHYRLLDTADRKPMSGIERHDYDLAETFWMKEFPQMSSRTRSGILAGVLSTIFTFNTGYVRELIGTTTNITPRVMDQGYFVLVNTPISRMGEEGAFILGIWKYLSQWHVMRRNPDDDNGPLVGFVDEMQNTISSMDSAYLAECRKFRGCLVGLSQGISSFYANMPGEQGKARTNALLTNFTHRILLALGDIESASWASSQVPNEWEMTVSGSRESINDFPYGLFSPSRSDQASYSEVRMPELEPTDFMHGMRTGGKLNNYQCDSIVIRSGEAFCDGRNWQRVIWSQK